MATKQLTLEGTIEWAKVFPENRDMKGYEGSYEACDGAYTVNLIMDQENFEVLQASGAAKATAKAELEVIKTGKTNIKFVRKHVGPFKEAGGPPKVLHTDGTPYSLEADGPIGNGSKARIKLSVYTTKMGPVGSRLDEVQLTELIKYEASEPDEPKETAPTTTEAGEMF